MKPQDGDQVIQVVSSRSESKTLGRYLNTRGGRRPEPWPQVPRLEGGTLTGPASQLRTQSAEVGPCDTKEEAAVVGRDAPRVRKREWSSGG